MSDKNFQVKNGLNINGVQVLDGNANGTFGAVTVKSINLENGASVGSSDPFVQASFNQANTASANTVYTQGVDASQNTHISAVESYGQSAFAQANTNAGDITVIQGVDAGQNTRITAVDAFAQAAYDTANTKFNTTGGTITGDTNITGNLTVSGATLYANITNLIVEDNTITLNSNVTGTPTLDSGLEVNRGNQPNTSIIWSESDKQWEITNDGTTFDGIVTNRSLSANVNYIKGIENTQNTNISAVDSFAGSAYTQANAATNSAQAAFNQANTNAGNITVIQGVNDGQNTAISDVRTYSSFGYSLANTNNSQIQVIQGVDGWQNTRIIAINNYANSAYTQANTGTNLAQQAYNFANTLQTGSAIDAYARSVADDAYAHADAAYSEANTNASDIVIIQGVNTNQNTRITAVDSYAAGAYGQANTNAGDITVIQGVNATQNTRITAIDSYAAGAYGQANTNASNIAVIQGVNSTQNTNITAVDNFAAGAYNKANTNAGDITVIRGVNIGQNNHISAVESYSQSAYGQANTNAGTITVIQGVDLGQNTRITAVDSYATSAYEQANAATNSAQAAFDVANTNATNITAVDNFAAGAYTQANAATNSSQAAYNKANTNGDAIAIIQGVDAGQNTRITAVDAFAQAAYNEANNKFGSAGGTITGNTVVLGNFTVTGETFYANTVNLNVEDNIITLNSNVIGSPSLDAGIEVNRGVQSNTKLIWNETDKSWEFTNDGTNYQKIAGLDKANSSYNQANAATNSAQAAYNQANTNADAITVIQGVNLTQNTNISAVDSYATSAYGQANATNSYATSAYGQANAATNSAQAAYNKANTNGDAIAVIQGVDVSQNTRITSVDNFAAGAYTQANATNNYATSAYAQANATNSYSVSAYGHANASYTQANAATESAQSAYNKANTNGDAIAIIQGVDAGQNTHISAIESYVTSSYGQANATNSYATSAYGQANAATNSAQAAYNKANTNASDITIIQGVDLGQNTRITAVDSYAAGAYGQANTATTLAQAAFNKANTESSQTFAQAAFDTANTASANTVYTQGVDATQNTRITAVDSYATGAYDQANTVFGVANGINIYATNAYVQANAATNSAQGAFNQANAATNSAQSAYNKANTNNDNIITIQSVDVWQNTRIASVEGTSALAFLKANDAYALANAGYIQANAATNSAQAAYNAANTKFNTSGGTITGDTTVTGNLTVTGTTFYANTLNVNIEDNIVTLNSNVTGTPSLDAGIEINRGTSANTKLLWSETDKAWEFTNDGTNYQKIAGLDKANSSYDQANAANSLAQSAYNQANTNAGAITIIQGVNVGQNTYISSVESYSQSAYGQANAATNSAQSAYNQANTTNTNLNSNITYVQGINDTQNTKTSAVDSYAAGAYGLANTNASDIAIIQGVNVGQNTRITAVDSFATSAYVQANAATNSAQAAYNRANTSNLTISMIDASNVVSNSVAQVNTIRFDSDAGFDVTDLGSGVVKVGMNSTFKYWEINGVQTLTAQGLDTVNFIGQNGISITGDGNSDPQSITFDASVPLNLAQAAFDQANTASSNVIYTQGVDITQNNRITAIDSYAAGAYGLANTNAGDISVIQGVNITQNTNISAVDSYAQSAYSKANTNGNAISVIQGVDLGQNTRITAVDSYSTSAYGQANAATNSAQAAYNQANTNAGVITVIQGVDAGQNTKIAAVDSYAAGAYSQANTNASDIVIIQSVNTTQNNNITSVTTFAQNAYNAANTKVNKSGDTITGNLTIEGQANVHSRLSVGTGAYQILPNLISQFTGTSDFYSQVNQQNLSANGSGDMVITASNGSDLVNYTDMGMSGNTYDNTTYNAFPMVYPNDGYFVVIGNPAQDFGGNVYYGTTGSGSGATVTGDIVFIQGQDFTEVARFATGQGLIIETGKDSTNQTSGALVVDGGLGVSGSIYGGNVYDNGIRIVDIISTANTDLKNYVDNQVIFNAGINTTQNTNITAVNNFTQGAFNKANAVNTFAQDIYNVANTKLSTSGGSITGNVSVGTFLDLVPQNSTPSHTEGRVWYSNTHNVLTIDTDVSGVTTELGRQLTIKAYNNSGVTITKGMPVYVTGGNLDETPYIAAAQANSYNKIDSLLGAAQTNIPDGEYGYIVTNGPLTGVNTSGITAGKIVYVSAATPGGITDVDLGPPDFAVHLGVCLVSDLTNGVIYIDKKGIEWGANFTDGAIAFGNGYRLTQDPTQFFWDYTNHRLGIGTNTPQANLHVEGSGLFTGNVTISGNLIVTNAQAISTSTLTVSGNTIVLNETVTGSPTTNASIIVNRGTEPNSFISWSEQDDEWVIGNGLTQGHLLDSSKVATSWSEYSTFDPYEKISYPIGATLSNSINQFAQAGYNAANVAQDAAVSATNIAQGAFDKANAVSTYAESAYSSGNTTITFAQAAFDKANSASANTVVIQGVDNTQNTNIQDANTRAINAQSTADTANTTANAAKTLAEGAFDKANTAANGVTSLSTASSSRITVSSATGASTIDLATVGSITAGTYTYPSLQVDSYGRVITISNQTPVTSFNTRTGVITLTSGDVTTALGYTPTDSSVTTVIQGVDLTQNTRITAVDSYATSAYAQANAATNSAQAAYNQANSAYNWAACTVLSLVNSADEKAQAAFNKANTDYTTISTTAGVYGGSTNIPVITLSANGRVSSITNTAISIPASTTITDDTTGDITLYPLMSMTSSGTLSLANTSSSKLTYNPSTGTLTTVDLNTTSDAQFKENVETIQSPIDIINTINGVSFNWKDSGNKSYGVIAQELQKVLPELVTQGDRGLTVSYLPLIAILIEAVKEQQKQIDELKKQ